MPHFASKNMKQYKLMTTNLSVLEAEFIFSPCEQLIASVPLIFL